jgi:Amt family ammonium transporter
MILNCRKTRETKYAITMCKNGGLSGIVDIMVGCSLVEPWAAVLVGIIVGWTYIFWSSLLVKIRIDDAVDAIPIHFGNGIWGCILAGHLSSQGYCVRPVGAGDRHGRGQEVPVLHEPAQDCSRRCLREGLFLLCKFCS